MVEGWTVGKDSDSGGHDFVIQALHSHWSIMLIRDLPMLSGTEISLNPINPKPLTPQQDTMGLGQISAICLLPCLGC